MNAQPIAPLEADAPIPDGQALALPPNLGDLCEGRNQAIALWLESYDTLHANMDAAAAASIGGKIALQPPSHERYETSSGIITRAFLTVGEHQEWSGHNRVTTPAREHFASIVTAEVDRRCWGHMMVKLEFDTLLDRQAREEFHASLKTDPPAFTEENCRATFGTLWGSRRDMYLRGIANVFMKMDRRFRSHDAFAIGNRLIIERAMGLDSWSGWNSYDRRDTLHDVERIFRELDGRTPLSPNIRGGIVHEVEDAKKAGGLPTLVQGDYFRVRVFQNGNLHLWFERKDLLAEVNKLLLEYYKPVEGDVGEGPSYESAPLFHTTPAKYFGEFFTSPEVAQLVMDRASMPGRDGCAGRVRGEWTPYRVLEPSAGGGALALAAKAMGHTVQCVEIQPGLAHELGRKGLPTVEGDFLKMTPADLGLFDRIVMNPPFDRGRDCDHVRHAFTFLKPGGRLVSIMSARAEFGDDPRHKALHDLIAANRGSHSSWQEWVDLPERSFAHAGTNVNTVMLTITRRT